MNDLKAAYLEAKAVVLEERSAEYRRLSIDTDDHGLWGETIRLALRDAALGLAEDARDLRAECGNVSIATSEDPNTQQLPDR